MPASPLAPDRTAAATPIVGNERPLPVAIRGLVWGLAALAIGSLVAVGLLPLSSSYDDPWILPLFTGITASCGLVGAFIATRLPRNAVGWILWGFALATASGMVAQAYAAASLMEHGAGLPGTPVAAWYAGIPISPALAAVLLFLPVLFPEGRPPSRRWRPVLVLFSVMVGVVAFPPLFRPGPIQGIEVVSNPFGVPGIEPLIDTVAALGDVTAPFALPLAVGAPILRYRRGTAIERQQLKWFGSTAALAAAGLIAAVLVPDPYGTLGWVACMIALGFVPIAIGVAIFRYRLYEIDRIISRTLSYALVTALLAAVFIGMNLALQAVVSSATGVSTLGVAASTLVVAALFQPIRRRTQASVDRRFDRVRADAERAVAAFSARTRDEVDLAELHVSIVATVREAVHPEGAVLWLRRGP